MKQVGAIYSSQEYSKFKKLNGNRSVLEQRKNMIIASIQERGWIRNPIVVNEKMEIIDGQGRFEALKKLNMPVEYVVAKGATISDCIALNIKQKNWTAEDYIQCYADMGYSDYIILNSLMGDYPGIKNSSLHILVGKNTKDGSSPQIKDGTFTVYDPDSLKDRLNFAQDCLNIIGYGNGASRTWCSALKFVWFCEAIDKKVFLSKLNKCRSFLYPCVTVKQAIELLEKIYNYSIKKNKVYFIPEYEKWVKSLYE